MAHILASNISGLDIVSLQKIYKNEDELRLALLGYAQEARRIFGTFTNFGLAASMISVILGIIPLYSYSIETGGRRSVLIFCNYSDIVSAH